VSQSIELFLGELNTGLREERDNSDTRVTTNNGDLDILGVEVLNLSNEARGTDNIKGSNTIETLGVEDTSLLQGLGKDGDSGVDRVGDDEEVSVRAVPRNEDKVLTISFNKTTSLFSFIPTIYTK